MQKGSRKVKEKKRWRQGKKSKLKRNEYTRNGTTKERIIYRLRTKKRKGKKEEEARRRKSVGVPPEKGINEDGGRLGRNGKRDYSLEGQAEDQNSPARSPKM